MRHRTPKIGMRVTIAHANCFGTVVDVIVYPKRKGMKQRPTVVHIQWDDGARIESHLFSNCWFHGDRHPFMKHPFVDPKQEM